MVGPVSTMASWATAAVHARARQAQHQVGELLVMVVVGVIRKLREDGFQLVVGMLVGSGVLRMLVAGAGREDRDIITHLQRDITAAAVNKCRAVGRGGGP